MPLDAKPYSAIERIYRAIFKTKPNFFTDSDLNRQFEINATVQRALNLAASANSNLLMTASGMSYLGGNLTFTILWPSISVVFQGMQFDVSEGSISGTTVTPLTGASHAAIRVYLIATKKTVTFSDDPVISGVTGSTLTSPQPGAEHIVYSLPRFAWSRHTELPILGLDEEIICPMATIIPMGPGVPVPKFYMLTLAAYTNKFVSLLGNYFNPSSALELNQYMLDYMLNYLKDPIGTWKGFHGDVTGKFDSTGLGLDAYIGWAFMNGNNGTQDFRGRSPIMFDERISDPFNAIWDPLYNTIGNVIGAKKHVLSTAEMPPHSHTVTLYKNPRGPNDNPDHTLTEVVTVNGTAIINTSSAGTGDPHNNLQPSFVTGMILRIS